MAQSALPGHQDVKGIRSWTQLEFSQLYDLLELEERLAWSAGYQFIGLTIKSDSEGWLVVLRGARQGGFYVHFTGGRTFKDAVEALLWEVDKNALTWKPDKYHK